MGTRGYVVLKYKNIYYIFYNCSDSYLSSLGKLVVADIKEMLRKNLIKHVKNKIQVIPLKEGFDGEESHYQGLFEVIEYPTVFKYCTNDTGPEFDVFNEYTYIIDFDNEIFSIILYGQTELHFDLLNIPDDILTITENIYRNQNNNSKNVYIHPYLQEKIENIDK